jgi:hypothetical protein
MLLYSFPQGSDEERHKADGGVDEIELLAEVVRMISKHSMILTCVRGTG